MTNSEFSSPRNMAEIDAFEQHMEQVASYDSFEVYMSDAEKLGLGSCAITALQQASGDFTRARQYWSSENAEQSAI